MINDPRVQEFIAQNPEVKAFFDAQMEGTDPSSEEAKDKVLNLMGQFRRQMEEQGYGRDSENMFGGYVDGNETATTPTEEKDDVFTQEVSSAEQSYRVDNDSMDIVDDFTAGGYVDGNETATTPTEEKDDVFAQELSGAEQSYRVDDGQIDESGSDLGHDDIINDEIDPNADQAEVPPVQETPEKINQGIDTVLDDLDKENQTPSVQKDEKFFESKYKNFFDSDKSKEAWKNFESGLKRAKTVDDLFAAMVFGMLNFPFDMINAYCDHRKAEAKRMEEDFMKKLEANHSSAMGKHHDSTESFIKKLHDVNNNAVRESDPKLWEAMQQAGLIDKHGNVDKKKLAGNPELLARYTELSNTVGREARDNFLQSYDGTYIPHDHPMWNKYADEMDRMFMTTQAVGGLNHDNEPQKLDPQESQESVPTPPTPVPPTPEEYNNLQSQLAEMQDKLDTLTQAMQIMGQQNNVTVIVNINQNGKDDQTNSGEKPPKKPNHQPTGNLQGNYYDNISTAFKDIQATLGDERLTQQKLENMFESRYPITNGRTLSKTGGAAQDFGAVVKDKLEKGEITLEQAKSLLKMGADILAKRKSKGKEAKEGLDCLNQMMEAESAEDMQRIFEESKESIKKRQEKEQEERERLKQEQQNSQKADKAFEKGAPQIAPVPEKAPMTPIEKSAPAQTQEAPKHLASNQSPVFEILKASSEKGAELSAKEYKTEEARKIQMTRANNKILDKMLSGMKKNDQKKVLKALHEQILLQAKEKGLDANAQNLQRAIENRCKELSGRKMVVSKHVKDNKLKKDIVSQVKGNVSAKRAVQMARTNTVQRTVPPVMRPKGNENI